MDIYTYTRHTVIHVNTKLMCLLNIVVLAVADGLYGSERTDEELFISTRSPHPATHPVPDKLYGLCGRKTPCLLINPVVVCEGEREIGISRTCVSETVLFCFVIFTPVIVSFSREAPSFDLHTCRSCLKSGYKGSWGGFSRFCLLTMTAIAPAPTQISLAGAATSMIFVCRDKRRVLSRQKYACRDKHNDTPNVRTSDTVTVLGSTLVGEVSHCYYQQCRGHRGRLHHHCMFGWEIKTNKPIYPPQSSSLLLSSSLSSPSPLSSLLFSSS